MVPTNLSQGGTNTDKQKDYLLLHCRISKVVKPFHFSLIQLLFYFSTSHLSLLSQQPTLRVQEGLTIHFS